MAASLSVSDAIAEVSEVAKGVYKRICNYVKEGRDVPKSASFLCAEVRFVYSVLSELWLVSQMLDGETTRPHRDFHRLTACRQSLDNIHGVLNDCDKSSASQVQMQAETAHKKVRWPSAIPDFEPLIQDMLYHQTNLFAPVYDENPSDLLRVLSENDRNVLEDISKRSPDQYTGLQSAIQNGNPDSVANVLKSPAFDVNKAEEGTGLTAVHHACAADSVEILKLLIRHGADPCQLDASGWSALHHSVTNDNHSIQCLEYLLEHSSIDMSATSHKGLTCFHMAALHANAKALQFLISKGVQSLPIAQSKSHDGSTLIHCAAMAGSVEVMKVCLDANEDIKSAKNDGTTLLHCAVSSNSAAAVQFLLHKGLDPNMVAKDGSSPLHYALEGDEVDIDVVYHLLDASADPYLVRSDGKTPWQLLIESTRGVRWCRRYHCTPTEEMLDHPKLLILRVLISERALVMHVNSNGRPVIHQLCRALSASSLNWIPTALERLLEHGADLQSTDRNGKTALRAILDIWHETFLILFDLRLCGKRIEESDIETRLEKMTRVINCALDLKNDDTLLSNTWADPVSVILAVWIHDEDLVRKLLHYSPKLIVKYEFMDMTAVQAACRFGCSASLLGQVLDMSGVTPENGSDSHLVTTACDSFSVHRTNEMVTELLHRGFCPNSHPSSRNSPLMIAASHGDLDVLRTLLENGGDLSITTNLGWNVAHYAIFHDRFQVLQYLQDKSIEWDSKINFLNEGEDSDNLSALHLAARMENSRLLALLLDKMLISNVNAPTSNGFTPLHIASRADRPQNVSLLLQHKADYTLRTFVSKATPIHGAAFHGFPKVIHAFVEHGCDVVMHDIFGMTPAAVALKNGHDNIAAILEKHSETLGKAIVLFSPSC